MTGPGSAEAVRSLRRRPRRVVLRLAPGVLLERSVELPLAAERDVDRVLGFEMGRFTPFTAADVVWQADGLQRDAAQRRLVLRLSLVPKRCDSIHSSSAVACGDLPRVGSRQSLLTARLGRCRWPSTRHHNCIAQ